MEDKIHPSLFKCDSNSASANLNCTAFDGDEPDDNDTGTNTPKFDSCDILPDWIKPYFG